MVKVVVLGTRGFPGVQGGVETHCENLYPQLVAKGCEVVVFSRKPYVGNNRDSPFGWKLVIAGDADHEDEYSLGLKRKAQEISKLTNSL